MSICKPNYSVRMRLSQRSFLYPPYEERSWPKAAFPSLSNSMN